MAGYRRLFRLFLGTEVDLEREVEEEIRGHLEMRAADLERTGLSPEAARAEAERRFGDLRVARRGLRAAAREGRGRRRRREWLASVRSDVWLAARRARQSPTQTAVAVATLGLAIGLTTAGFTVVDGVLLRPLPFPESERLVRLETADSAGEGIPYLSEEIWLDWSEGARTLESSALFSFRQERWAFAEAEGAFNVDGVRVTPGFFHVFRTPMAAGRPFTAADREMAVAVVSEGFWRTELGSAPLPVEVDLAGSPRFVVGAVRSGYEFPAGTEAYLPFHPERDGGEAYNWLNEFGVGRLGPGVDREAASADLAAIARSSREQNPGALYLHGAAATPLRDHVTGDAGAYLPLVMAAVSVLLLIACANLAGLGVAQASGRRQEVALRLSLGAGRRRLVRQLLTEHLLLAAVGGGLGVGLAAVATRAFVDRAAGQLPRAAEIGLDLRVLGFAVAVSVAAGVLAGIVPALWGSRASLRESLGRGRGTARGGRRTPAALLVGLEVALALVLLTAGGVLARNFAALLDRDLGFDVEGIVTAETNLFGRYPAERQEGVWAELEDRLAARPGVAAAGFTNAIPTGTGGTGFIMVEGLEDTRAGAAYRVVSDGYLEAMGIGLLAGRRFGPEDGRSTGRVTVINRAMAERYWPGESPLGRRVQAYSMEGDSGTPGSAPWLTVVGVVEDIRHHGHLGERAAEMYVSIRQAPRPWFLVSMTAAVRAEPGLDAAALLGPVREAYRAQDPLLAVEVRTLEDRLSGLLAQHRTVLLVLSVFAALSLLLAALGLYGLLSYAVSESMHEMGIRTALGARSGGIMRLVLGRAFRVVIVGALAGLLAAWWATLLLESLLLDVPPRDPAGFAAALALLLGVTAAAALVPARRATRADPVAALRG